MLEEMLIEVVVILGMPEKMDSGEQGRYDMAPVRPPDPHIFAVSP